MSAAGLTALAPVSPAAAMGTPQPAGDCEWYGSASWSRDFDDSHVEYDFSTHTLERAEIWSASNGQPCGASWSHTLDDRYFTSGTQPCHDDNGIFTHDGTAYSNWVTTADASGTNGSTGATGISYANSTEWFTQIYAYGSDYQVDRIVESQDGCTGEVTYTSDSWTATSGFSLVHGIPECDGALALPGPDVQAMVGECTIVSSGGEAPGYEFKQTTTFSWSFRRTNCDGSIDSDGDRLSDCDEYPRGTVPTDPDTDGDGLSDGDEVLDHGTDPLTWDSDGDAYGDGAEVTAGTDPLDPLSYPGCCTDGGGGGGGGTDGGSGGGGGGATATRYVAMGDSFQSGEGARDYGGTKDDSTKMGPDPGLPPTDKSVRDFEGQDEGCHRSPNAYGPRVAKALGYSGSDFTFVACSGALSEHIRSEWFKGEEPQVSALGPDVELVTLGIGGNDVGFAETLAKCISGAKPCNQTEYDSVWELMDELVRRPPGPLTRSTLENTYLAVANAAPNAKVLILGYPRFFPEDPHQNTRKCSGIGVAEQAWINGNVGMLNMFISDTVSRLANEGHNIAYVHIEDVGTGHELCGARQGTHFTGIPLPENPLWDEFMNGVEFNYYETDNPLADLPFQPDTILVPVRSTESFHPNALGHSLIAPRVDSAAGTLPSHSMSAMSTTSEDSTLQAAAVSNQPPVAAFSMAVAGSKVVFDASASSDADGSVAEYVWDFGDGTTATGSKVSHTYSEGGHYVPKLVVSDDTGFVDIEVGETVSIDLDRVDRLSGKDRIETALAISTTSFPKADTAGAVVLATAGGYPDALAGTPLAAALGGPVLLNPSHGLDGRVADEMNRVLPEGGTVVLLGGEAVLSDGVERAVRNRGHHVVRLGGANRFETAKMVAEQGLGSPDLVFLATGHNFADALAAAAPAIAYKGAILLTGTDEAVGPTSDYLEANPHAEVIALGGPASRSYPDYPAIIGSDRFATATMIAEAFWPTPTRIGLASGTNFPDALAGGVHTGTKFGPMLLVPPSGSLPGSVTDYLVKHADTISNHSYLYGGPAAVGDGILEAVRGAIK